MGFFDRLTILAKADAHGVVDALEDRALVLRQHVREARGELERKRYRLSALAAQQKDLQNRQVRGDEKLAALEQDVALALQNEKEELARFAIKKLLPLRRNRQEILRRQEELQEERDELTRQLAEQEERFTELEERVRGYLAEQQDELAGGPSCAAFVSDEEVELELLRRRPATAEGGEA